MDEMRVKLPEGGEVIIKGKYVGGGVVITSISVPTLETVVNKVYTKYLEASKKDDLIEEAEDIAKSMGNGWIDNVEADYDPYEEAVTVKARIIDNKLYGKIQEVVRYLVGSWCYGDYWLIVSNKEKEYRRYEESMNKVKELGILDFGYTHGYWLKIAEINGKLDKWYAYIWVG